MAYDRYVAICNPLRYHHILNRKYCALLSIVTWVIGCLNSLMLTTSALKMYFCHNNVIKHYFCEANALKRIACAGREAFYSVVYFDLFFMGLCPVLCCLTSYAKIIRVIMSIKSKEGRQKTFSTCSSHAIVIFIYFGSGTLDYVMSLLEISGFQEEVLTVLYANVTPLLNPLIYSLRNKELKQGLQKVLGKMLTV
ncbi:olfactory receptor 2M5-like [Gastrophryne carolinensis]